MSIQSIELEGDECCQPGSTVRGRVVGSRIAGEVRLFWNTCGRGTEEVGVVDRQPLSGDGRFSLTLAEAPFTTQGTLVSIEWGIEWVDGSGDAVDRREIVVSPSGRPIRLARVDEPKSSKSKRVWKWTR